MAYSTTDPSEVDANSPVNSVVMGKVKDNFDYLYDSRYVGGWPDQETEAILTADYQYGVPFISGINGKANGLIIQCGNTATGNIKPGLWADSAGAPGALLASGGAVALVSYRQIWCPFSAAASVTLGTQYWYGFVAQNSSDQIMAARGVQGEFRNLGGGGYTGGPTNPFGTLGGPNTQTWSAHVF